MPKKTFHIYNDNGWARCPCGWSWVGADDGRGTKELAKKLHAKKCETYAYCLQHPEQFVQNVSTYQGGGNAGGRLHLGENLQSGINSITEMVDRVDTMSATMGTPLPTEIDERKQREKKAQENRKKRLAKKRAKARKRAEKEAENEPSAE